MLGPVLLEAKGMAVFTPLLIILKKLINAWPELFLPSIIFRFALNEETALRKELSLACLLVTLTACLPASFFQNVLMNSFVVFLLIVQFLNSSVEYVIDRISTSHHGLSKRVKDYGSTAVFLALSMCICFMKQCLYTCNFEVFWQILEGFGAR